LKALLIKLTLQALTDQESRKRLMVIIMIPVMAVFLIMTLLVYILTSPFSFLTGFFLSGEERAAMREFKDSYGSTVRIISDDLDWGVGRYPMPMKGRITSDYGDRIHPVTGRLRHHNGIDIASGVQEQIIAIAPGQVVEVGINPREYGQYVLIRNETDADGVFYTFYAHLAKVYVLPDQEVFQGSIIGLEGGGPDDPIPGNSTGRHLHFEIRERASARSHADPYYWLFESAGDFMDSGEEEMI